MELLKRKINDKNILLLLSQIFANIYLNKIDQFIKHRVKFEYYLRYADDFLILSTCFNDLNHLINTTERFLLEIKT